MSLNLELKPISKRVEEKNTAFAMNLALIEQKITDVHSRVFNMIHSLGRLIRDEDVEKIVGDYMGLIQDYIDRNEGMTGSFESSGISFREELRTLSLRYGDNRFRLRNIATNNVLSGHPDDYIYSGVDFLDDYTFTTNDINNKSASTRLVKDTRARVLNGVTTGALSGPNSDSTGFTSLPGYGRNLFVRMFNSLEVVDEYLRRQQQPFTEESNNVRGLDSHNIYSAPFIVIGRTNKIHSFDFGIEYKTKNNTIDLYVNNFTNPIVSINKNVGGEFTKNFYGSFVIKDTTGTPEVSYILYNSEKSYIRNDLPEFKFRLAYDTDNIFIFLESVKPYSLTYAATEDELYIRDILEMMWNMDYKDVNVIPDTFILSIKNKWGAKFEAFSSDTVRNTLRILAPFAGDKNAAKNLFVLPKYSVNMSLKDNSFYSRDSFIVGNLFNNSSTLLKLPCVYMNIKSNSEAQIQLNGVGVSIGNNISVSSDTSVEDSKLSIVNTVYSSDEGRFVRSKTVLEMVYENDEFIKSKSVNGGSVFYHTRIMMATRLNSGLQVDTDKIPDYVIHEFGQYYPGRRDRFNCRYFVIHNDMNDLVEITDLDSLRKIATGSFIPFTYTDDIKDGVVSTVVNKNALNISSSNMMNNSHEHTLPIFFGISGLNVDDNKFMGLIRLDTRILPDFYEVEELDLQHITYAENNTGRESVYGVAAKQHINQEDLTNQVRPRINSTLTHKIFVKANVDKFRLSVDGPVTLVESDDENYLQTFSVQNGSNVIFSVEPFITYVAQSVTVNGVSRNLVDGKYIVLNGVSSDTVLNIQLYIGDMFTVTIVVDGEGPGVGEEGNDILEDGNYFSYEGEANGLVRQRDEDGVFVIDE